MSTKNPESDEDSGIDFAERPIQRVRPASAASRDLCGNKSRNVERHPSHAELSWSHPKGHLNSKTSDFEKNMRRTCHDLLANLYSVHGHNRQESVRFRRSSAPVCTRPSTLVKRLSVSTPPSHSVEPRPSLGSTRISVPAPRCDNHCRHNPELSSTLSNVASASGGSTNISNHGNLLEKRSRAVECKAPRTTEFRQYLPTVRHEKYVPDHIRVQEAGVLGTRVDVVHKPRSSLCVSASSQVIQSLHLAKPKTAFPPKMSPLSLPVSGGACPLGFGLDPAAGVHPGSGEGQVSRMFVNPESMVCEKISAQSSIRYKKTLQPVGNCHPRVISPPVFHPSLPHASVQSGTTNKTNSTKLKTESGHQRALPRKTEAVKDISRIAIKSSILNRWSVLGGAFSQDPSSPKSSSMPTLFKGPDKLGMGGVNPARVRKKKCDDSSTILRIKSTPCIMEDNFKSSLPSANSFHTSDSVLYRGTRSTCSLNSAASSSLSEGSWTLRERFRGLRRGAQSALLRAFSTESIYRPQKSEISAAVATDQERQNGEEPTLRPKSTSRVSVLKERMSFRRKKRHLTSQGPAVQVSADSDTDPLWAGGQPAHVCGQLLQGNADGSHVVELSRPQGQSFGFFLARGRIRDHQGVFVSRMHDGHTEQALRGLLEVNDEIVEVNGTDVQHADIMTVNSLMANQNTLLLTVLPYICRKDI